MKHQFSDALRAARQAKQLSQEDLGIPQSHASRLENGQKMPSWERVEALAEVLDVHPLTLFTLSYMFPETSLSELTDRVQKEIAAIRCVSTGIWSKEP